MIYKDFPLLEPFQFSMTLRSFDKLKKDEILVRPTYLSICKADLRYYRGLRPHEILKKKLPLTLIHEASGEIIFDDDKNTLKGQNIILIPQFSVSKTSLQFPNYDKNSLFASSTISGFLREYLVLKKENILLIPSHIDPFLGPFVEPLSVLFHACERLFPHSYHSLDSVILGDGIFSYLLSLILKFYYKTKVHILGKHKTKLNQFTFVDEKGLYEQAKILEEFFCFDCTGSKEISHLEKLSQKLPSETKIALIGVHDEKPLFPLRICLEKGLTYVGISRSSKHNFEQALQFLNSKIVREKLFSFINCVQTLNTIEDIKNSFEYASSNIIGKVILKCQF